MDIPGIGSLSGAAGTIGSIANIFGVIVAFAATGGIAFLIVWVLNNKVFSFNIPVTLKFEVGGSIIEKKDKLKIRRHDDIWEVRFKKNSKLIAQVPPDECAYFKTSGLKTIKTFEGFVRDNQVAWTWPKPQTTYTISQGEGFDPVQVEGFVTMPSNMVEFQAAESRRNEELATKKKWWENPVALSYAAIGFMILALIFIYLLYKSVPDQINAYLSFAKSVAEGCPGVQIQ